MPKDSGMSDLDDSKWDLIRNVKMQAYEEFSQCQDNELEINNQLSQEPTGESEAMKTGSRKLKGYNLLS